MFGTLVVQLPSDYSGGQLVVSHGGKEKVFDFSGIKGCTNFHFAAFYADCQHELKKSLRDTASALSTTFSTLALVLFLHRSKMDKS